MEFDERFDQQIFSLIADCIPGRFKKIKFTKNTYLQKELGLDSIAILALVFRFEETFGVDLSQMDLKVDVGRLRTVGDLISISKEILQRPKAIVQT